MPDEEITFERFTAYRLANMADCASPDYCGGEDREPSPGAAFLLSVQDATAEHLAYGGDPSELSEIADGAPDVYTHARWLQFVDLCAYQEDPSELGGDPSDMTAQAGICLYMIAERLAAALVAEWAEGGEDA